MDKWEYKALLEESADNGTFPSTGTDGCAYRGNYTKECPKRCAIGLLIPDALYDPDMENKSVKALLNEHPELKEYVNIKGLTTKDLDMIQDLHDSIADRGEWNPELFKEDLNDLICFEDTNEV